MTAWSDSYCVKSNFKLQKCFRIGCTYSATNNQCYWQMCTELNKFVYCVLYECFSVSSGCVWIWILCSVARSLFVCVCVCVRTCAYMYVHMQVCLRESERERTYVGTLIHLCFTFYRAVGCVFCVVWETTQSG